MSGEARRLKRPDGYAGWSSPGLPAEMYEQATEVLRVLLHPVVLRLDLFLLKELQHVLLELPGTLAGDNLDQRGLLRHGLVDDRLQRPVDVLSPFVNVMQVQFQLHDHRQPRPRRQACSLKDTVPRGS